MKQKRKQFINILTKVKGYPDFNKEALIKENVKITVDDVRLVLKAVSDVDLKIMDEKLVVEFSKPDIHLSIKNEDMNI